MKSQIGVGLRHQHFPYLEENPTTSIDFFEIISENFMYTRGRPFEFLQKIRKDYPISMHGVSLSIGSYAELDFNYLAKLKELIDIVDPFIVSDHLCWTGLKENNLHNLLPLPYTDKTIDFLSEKIKKTQDYLKREICIENLSAYFSLKESTITEWDFLRILAEKSGCKILLDINNIYVNAINQKFDPYTYLDAIPMSHVGEIHLAGFSDMGDYLFDTHSAPVFKEVWKLYDHKIKEGSNIPTLIEWDEDIPDFPVLEAEALKAKKIWTSHHGN
jgi:uncharacterized protein (UPF0276 family)